MNRRRGGTADRCAKRGIRGSNCLNMSITAACGSFDRFGGGNKMSSGYQTSLLVLGFWLTTLALYGCGGGSAAPPPPPPQLAFSKISGSGGFGAYSNTVACSLLNGANPSPNGMPIAWSLTASSVPPVPMNFTITPTVPWLTLSPLYGTLLAGGSTLITVTAIDTTQMPLSKNIVGFLASAPGYQDNTLLGLEIAFEGTTLNGTKLCKVAYTGDPSQFPLP